MTLRFHVIFSCLSHASPTIHITHRSRKMPHMAYEKIMKNAHGHMRLELEKKLCFNIATGYSKNPGSDADHDSHITPVHTENILYTGILWVLPTAAVQWVLLLAVQLQVPSEMCRQSAQHVPSGKPPLITYVIKTSPRPCTNGWKSIWGPTLLNIYTDWLASCHTKWIIIE